MIILAAGVFLEVAHIYPVGKHIPGVPTTFETEGGADDSPTITDGPRQGPDNEKPDRAGSEEKSDAEDKKIKQLIAAAEKSIENNQLNPAIDKLKAAKVLDPKRPEIYTLLGDVYDKLGQKKKADKNHKTAEKLKADKKGEAVTQKGDDKTKKEDDNKEKSPGESSN
ncbi:MAG: tetratricopeptide repeat protein [Bradymonadaceae bacterium]